MADRRDRDLTADRRGADPLLSTRPMKPGRGDVIGPVDRQKGKGFEVPDHLPKRRFRPKRLQDLLQDGSGEDDVPPIPQQSGQFLDGRMVGRPLLAQSEGPDRRVHQDSQPRRFRSAL